MFGILLATSLFLILLCSLRFTLISLHGSIILNPMYITQTNPVLKRSPSSARRTCVSLGSLISSPYYPNCFSSSAIRATYLHRLPLPPNVFSGFSASSSLHRLRILENTWMDALLAGDLSKWFAGLKHDYY